MSIENCPNLSVMRFHIFRCLINEFDSQINIYPNLHEKNTIEISRLNSYNNWKNESYRSVRFSYGDLVAELCELAGLKQDNSLSQMKELSMNYEDSSGTLLLVLFKDAMGNIRVSLYVKKRNNDSNLKMIDSCVDILNEMKTRKETPHSKKRQQDIIEPILKKLEDLKKEEINE